MYHVRGLNVLFLMPLFFGMYTFLYTNPFHIHVIPKLIYELGATTVVGNDTFANAWAREASPMDFSTLRIFLSGSERVKERTHELFSKKFGLRLYEGYGLSEAAPVLSLSTKEYYRVGSCGRFLPGLKYKLEPVPGLPKGGVLHVKGPNLMLGYLVPGKSLEIEPPPDHWHNTGDIVELDDDGYVWIKGRYKRFAKIGGEIVSLVAVEELLNKLWPGRPLAVMVVEDKVKGERLVLLTQESSVDVVQMRDAIRKAGLPDIAVPRQFVRLDNIAMNTEGKPDLAQIQKDLDEALRRQSNKS
jgi:acyl-[acyl-carrier-protein]-phospholipid O-acyltransferase/long-chain-fatty-acid--[acyl-carrier-protein] ligase